MRRGALPKVLKFMDDLNQSLPHQTLHELILRVLRNICQHRHLIPVAVEQPRLIHRLLGSLQMASSKHK